MVLLELYVLLLRRGAERLPVQRDWAHDGSMIEPAVLGIAVHQVRERQEPIRRAAKRRIHPNWPDRGEESLPVKEQKFAGLDHRRWR
jgi:hypothetical protein